jgi:hypothetical protein
MSHFSNSKHNLWRQYLRFITFVNLFSDLSVHSTFSYFFVLNNKDKHGEARVGCKDTQVNNRLYQTRSNTFVCGVRVMVFNTTSHNISIIPWRYNCLDIKYNKIVNIVLVPTLTIRVLNSHWRSWPFRTANFREPWWPWVPNAQKSRHTEIKQYV